MGKSTAPKSITWTLIQFSIPLILSGLLQQLYNWADAFIVGNMVGEGALAAVGATAVVSNLFIMAITGFTSGVSILSARLYGSGDTVSSKKALSSFIVTLGALSIILSAAGAWETEALLRLLRTPEDIFTMSRYYLQIIFAGIPFLAVYNVYAAVLRGTGDSKSPFLAVVVSSAANLILDILLVGVFHLGVAGAAIATVFSQALMCLFIVLYTIKKYPALRFSFDLWMLDAVILKSGCALALPITVQSVVSAVGNLFLQNFMNGFGTQTVAAITTAYRVDSVIMLPVINLGTGIATIVAQNMGAGEPGRAKKCLFSGAALMALVSLSLTALVLVLGGGLIELFGVTEEATLIGIRFFHSIAWFYIVFGWAMAVRGYLEGTGDVVFSGMGGILTLGVRILLSYALLPYFGNMVIAYAEAISWCFQLLLYTFRFYVKKQPVLGFEKNEKVCP